MLATMEVSSLPTLSTVGSRLSLTNSTACFVSPRRTTTSHGLIISTRRITTPLALADTVGHSEITWQIIVGTIAGITPFVVAGVEFSKRIIAQKKCQECRGSGLVFRDKKYYPCPECVLEEILYRLMTMISATI